MRDASDFLQIVLITVVISFAVLGVMHLTMDYRMFDNIVKDCKEMGYVQNEKIRLECKEEKR